MTTTTEAEPTTGSLVSVRGQKWIVGDVDAADSSTLVTLQSVEEGKYGDTLEAIRKIEPRRRILPSGSLPKVNQNSFDSPEKLAASPDAIRWSAITSADVKNLQAPLRFGVVIENYRLEPVARAVGAPRVNLLLADDVGLGKTIEGGLVAQDLLLPHRSHRITIVCPAGLATKWKDEMADKFGLDFMVINTHTCTQVRREYGSTANPFNPYPVAIVSLTRRGCIQTRRPAEDLHMNINALASNLPHPSQFAFIPTGPTIDPARGA